MTVFSVWAPAANRVDVEVAGRPHPMSPGDRPGWWTTDVADAPDGTDYAFRLDGGEALADPRSPRQPGGPAGQSRTYDHAAFAWTDGHWRGAPLSGAVIYELHVGTFTPEGTLDAAIERLGHLIDLGVTVVELMPLAAFPGESRLGIRRDRPVGGARALWRAGRAEAVRGRLPRARARRLPRCRLQPCRAGQSARLVRALLHRRAPDAVGPGGQPGPAGLR